MAGLLLSPHLYANGKILVFGDSLSAGFGLQTGDSWVDLLQEKLTREHIGYQILNGSITGDTSGNGLRRLPPTLEEIKPAVVILELGGNDGLRGLNLDQTRKNLAAMIDLIRASGAKVLLVGMQIPPNYGMFYRKKFSQMYADLAKEKQIPFLPFLLQGFETNMGYFQADGIHPNKKAQPLIVKNIWPKLRALLH